VIKILPVTKKLKQLIKSFGDEWRIISYKENLQCFQDEGWLVETLCKKHRRWCRKEELKDLKKDGSYDL